MALMEQKTEKQGVVKLKKNWYVLRDARAVVEVVPKDVVHAAENDNLYVDGNDFAKWGKDNLLPQRMLRLVSENHLKPQLLVTERDFLLGSRISLFTRIIENKKVILEPVQNPEIEDWMEEVEAHKYIRRAAYNFAYFANVFTHIGLSNRRKVELLECFDCTDIRARKRKKGVGRVEAFYLHPDWENYRPGEAQTIAAYDPKDPYRFSAFIYHGKDEMPGQTYYDTKAWWGTRRWTEVSNQIPVFHMSGLKNGYNIKYHIQIPANYFDDFEDPEEAEEELIDDLNDFLSGIENPDKALISKYSLDQFNKEIAGWKIEPIDNKNSGEAYLNLDKQANTAHASGHGIDPSLAGIDTGSKLGGSGSEKRISYQLHIALRTPQPRQILLEPFNKVIKKIMGWDRNLFFGFEDIEITTLEDNPTGQQSVTNQQQ
jgi:hypothetical protein